jgi:hypothetical protein
LKQALKLSEYAVIMQLNIRPYGIPFDYATTYLHQQYGVPERLNRTLLSLARAMLQELGLPKQFWQDTIETVCSIENRTPIGPNGKTPEDASI